MLNRTKNILALTLVLCTTVSFAQPGKDHMDIPDSLQVLLKGAYDAERGREWNTALQLYSEAIRKYPKERGYRGTTLYYGTFQKAKIFADYLNELDSSLYYLSFMVRELSGQIDGPYEGEGPVDVSAAQYWAETLDVKRLENDKRLNYLNALKSECGSNSARAVVDIELASIHYEQKDSNAADSLLYKVILGPPLPWSIFKSSGDFRWSAIKAMAYLGDKHVSNEYAITAIEKLKFDLLEPSLQLITAFSLGELYQKAGDSLEAKKRFTWCSDHSDYRSQSDYSFSFGPNWQMVESYWFSRTLNDKLEELN